MEQVAERGVQVRDVVKELTLRWQRQWDEAKDKAKRMTREERRINNPFALVHWRMDSTWTAYYRDAWIEYKFQYDEERGDWRFVGVNDRYEAVSSDFNLPQPTDRTTLVDPDAALQDLRDQWNSFARSPIDVLRDHTRIMIGLFGQPAVIHEPKWMILKWLESYDLEWEDLDGHQGHYVLSEAIARAILRIMKKGGQKVVTSYHFKMPMTKAAWEDMNRVLRILIEDCLADDKTLIFRWQENS